MRHDNGFVRLWPTTLLQRHLPGSDAANRLLHEIILRLERDNAELTTAYRSGNFFTDEHPVVRWLRECVNRTASDYLRRQGVDYAVALRLHGWANVNRRGDYHSPHNHPHSYLSGTYYVTLPDQSGDLGGRGDLSPGAITLYDPRPQANMNAIRGDAQVASEHTILPQPGMILMWPSFLQHFVHPNFSHDPRVSISFNLMLERVDDYLPEQ